MKVVMAQRILRANDQVARENRQRLQNILTINLISSPGAGKTSILEKTLAALKDELGIAVLEGDIYTTRDAERIAGQGVDVVQINTQGLCHLDANMVGRALDQINMDGLDLLFIENVGNLVCPAEFNLGEDCKVAVLSVAEGGDKPAKYPLIFQQARATVINKTDFLALSDFDVPTVCEELKTINPDLDIFLLSAKSGEGMDAWYDWLREQVRHKKESAQSQD